MRPKPVKRRGPSRPRGWRGAIQIKKGRGPAARRDLDYPVARCATYLPRMGLPCALSRGTSARPALDLVIALGGDGTVLRAFARFPQRPVLAINFGTVGFLTAGDRKDLARIVQLLADGQYFVSERLVLSCRYPGGESQVFNEVTLRAHHKMLSTDVFVDDAKIRTIRGDGVVVGTPTGSTGCCYLWVRRWSCRRCAACCSTASTNTTSHRGP